MAYGKLTVICGPMFGGKTTELIRLLEINKIAGREVIAFKPSADTRYSKTKITTHIGNSFPAKVINNSDKLIKKVIIDDVPHYDVVGIDEAQFLTGELPLFQALKKLLSRGVDVIVSALAQDSKGDPFGDIPAVMAIADKIIISEAVCGRCRSFSATKSYCKEKKDTQVAIGGEELYEARCNKCWKPR